MITITKDKIYASPYSLKSMRSDSIDITEVEPTDIHRHLSDLIEIGDDVDFRRIFDLILIDKDLYNSIFSIALSGKVLDSYIDEYEQDRDKYDNSDVYDLMLYRNADLVKIDGDIILLENIIFSGFGKMDKDNDEFEYPISVSLMSLNNLKYRKVSIDMSYSMFDDTKVSPGSTNSDEDDDQNLIIKVDEKPFSLFDLIEGILAEISFYGDPSDRNNIVDKIQKEVFDSREDDIDFDKEYQESKDVFGNIEKSVSDFMDKDDYTTKWEEIYPDGPFKRVKRDKQEVIDESIISMSISTDNSLENQLNEAHSNEDYERASKIKKLIEKRDK